VSVEHHERLARLLDVSRDELRQRAQTLFSRESGRDYPVPIVLCGMGRLGQITLHGLRRTNAHVVAVADNNPKRQGEQLNGHSILSVDDAADRFGDTAVFVPTIYTARPLRDQLRQKGLRVASARALFFQYPEELLPHASISAPDPIAEQRDEILAGLDLWSDEPSKAEYVAQLAWQSLAELHVPDWVSPEEIYFPSDLVRLGANEVFVDCGAFDGDSVRAFLARTGGHFGRVLAFEPDPENFENLETFVATLPPDQRERIQLAQVAVHSASGTLKFASASGAGSSVDSTGNIEVRAEPLDSLLRGIRPTFIKMDIEGAEPNALAGAAMTLRSFAPTLAVCVYHDREHLWRIPQIIRDANPEYRLFLRRYSDESWESVCYAMRAH
jgi:FkbM family methyltransferase